MNLSAVAATLAAIAALVGAFFTYRTSTRANATSDRKVDLEEFRDQQARYKEMLAEQDRMIERLRNQMDRVQDQLAREQDVSNALRNEVRALQVAIDTLTAKSQQAHRPLN